MPSEPILLSRHLEIRVYKQSVVVFRQLIVMSRQLIKMAR